jgi:hypothetical protein
MSPLIMGIQQTLPTDKIGSLYALCVIVYAQTPIILNPTLKILGRLKHPICEGFLWQYLGLSRWQLLLDAP